MKSLVCALAIAASVASPVIADRISFTGGGKLDCTVVQESPQRVTAIYANGLMTLDRSMIASIEKDPNVAAACATPTARLPDWSAVVRCAAAKPWAKDIKQTAAAVVDVGPLANVPYKSQTAGVDYEVNVYGDPAKPAGFEVGVFGPLANDKAAQDNCLDLVAGLLGNKDDTTALRGINRKGGLLVRDGVTFEITPPDAVDAFNGWWVSVYATAEIEKARATADELKQVTVARDQARRETSEAREALRLRAQSPPQTTASGSARRPSDDDDIGAAAGAGYDDTGRGSPRTTTASKPSSGTGRVYVHSYYRKDGTYVSAHTRSRPRK